MQRVYGKSYQSVPLGDRSRELRRQKAFDEKYGDKLGTYARAYQARTEPGHHYLVPRGDYGYIQVKEALVFFTEALVEAISSVPKKSRAKWLYDFFRELDQL